MKRSEKLSTAQATRMALSEYERGKLYTMQDDLTRTGLMYDIEKLLGFWPSREAVKKAMQKEKTSICINRVKSLYQKK